MGKGYSGPIVSEQFVFSTESVDDSEVTHAYNRANGTLEWSNKWAGQMKVPFEKTWSCYKGEELHCGRCGTCVERREAFHLAGLEDPTPYHPDAPTISEMVANNWKLPSNP